MRQWTMPTLTLQSDHPDIIALAKKILDKKPSDCSFIAKANDYVFTKLQKRNTSAFSNALETLRAGYGDCGEHAALLAALLRVAGIPARVALGLLYVESKKRYFYHAQVMAYAGEWIFCDPTWGTFPAYGRFVPLIIDDTGTAAMRLSRILGKIEIHCHPVP
jgi:transglutaminase-like putative cysteine protease